MKPVCKEFFIIVQLYLPYVFQTIKEMFHQIWNRDIAFS